MARNLEFGLMRLAKYILEVVKRFKELVKSGPKDNQSI